MSAMRTYRKPWTVESVWANAVQTVLVVAGLVLVFNGHPGWGLFSLGASMVVYVFALATEHVHRTYPPEEHP